MSDQPLLGAVQGNMRPRTRSKGRRRGRGGGGASSMLTNMLRGGLIAPSATTYGSMAIILNTPDPSLRDELTKSWMDHKLEELNFVGIVGGLLSGCLTSTGSWPDVLSNGRDKPWVLKACWFSGLIFAVFAVLVATQQGLRLHRLSGHRDGLALVRRCMAADRGSGEKNGEDNEDDHEDGAARGLDDDDDDDHKVRRPRLLQVYAWQASLWFLLAAVVCLVGGMLILVWVSAAYGPEKRPEDGWWDSSSYLALVFTIAVGLSTIAVLIVQASLSTELHDE